MIIVGLSDIHGDVSRLRDIMADLAAADVVVVAGDITHFGNEAAAAGVIKALRRLNKHVLAVTGNCDSVEAGLFLTREGINLTGTTIVIDKVAFAGLDGSLECPGRTLNEYTEEQLESHLTAAAVAWDEHEPMILVTHEPPKNTKNDYAGNGEHAGSVAVRRFIEKHQPLICFTGHIHEAVGIDTIGRTQVVNPGPLRKGGYAYAQVQGETVELEIRGLRR